MNDDNLFRLAAELDSQTLARACHRHVLNPPPTESVFKLAVEFLKGLRRAYKQSR
jgi:hypothetical protein